MNLKPLRDYVIVKPVEEEETTKSGIVIPDTARKEKPQEGEVIAVGSGKLSDDGKSIPLEVKEGDRIIYSKFGPSEIKIDDQEYLIVKEEYIYAIIS